jgi:hypothetical protein
VNLFGEPERERPRQLTIGEMLQAQTPPPVASWPDEAPAALPVALPAARPVEAPPVAQDASAAPAPALTPAQQWRRWTARPWAASTPADKRIARQYKSEETPPMF